MKPVIVLLCLLAMLILIGCTELRDPMEPSEESDGASRRQPASPFYDATRPEPYDDLPAWEDRPSEEREAWRERHR